MPDSGEPILTGSASTAASTAATSAGVARGGVADRLEVFFDDGRRAAVGTEARPATPVAARATDPVPRHRGARAARLLAALVLLGGAWAAASAAMLVRPAGIPPWRSVWAEDGTRFLPGAIRSPGPGTWWDPFGGYRHLLPRLIGDLAARFPLVDASVVLAVASSVVAGAALVLFAVGLRRWLPAAWMQAGVVLAVAAAHAMAGEIAANAANLHWYLTLGLVGLALLRPRHLTTALAAAAVAAAFALSDPFSPLVAALALADAAWWTATRRRTVRTAAATWMVPLTLTAGAVAQVATMVADPRTPSPFAARPYGDLPALYLDRVLRDGLSPVPLARFSDDTLLLVTAAAAVVLLGLAVAAAGARHRLGSHTVIGVLLVAASPAAFAGPVLVNHTVADRYAAAPVALLVAGLLVLAAGMPRVGPVVFLAACAGLVALGLASFATHPVRGAGPDYVAAARHAAATECRTPGQVVRVPVAPIAAQPGAPRWFTELPCDRITTGPLDLRLP